MLYPLSPHPPPPPVINTSFSTHVTANSHSWSFHLYFFFLISNSVPLCHPLHPFPSHNVYFFIIHNFIKILNYMQLTQQNPFIFINSSTCPFYTKMHGNQTLSLSCTNILFKNKTHFTHIHIHMHTQPQVHLTP